MELCVKLFSSGSMELRCEQARSMNSNRESAHARESGRASAPMPVKFHAKRSRMDIAVPEMCPRHDPRRPGLQICSVPGTTYRRGEQRFVRRAASQSLRRAPRSSYARTSTIVRTRDPGARRRRALIAPQLGRWSHSTFGMHPRGGGWGRHTAHRLVAHRLVAYWSRRRSR